jgi:CSLREA domain-containing protein
MPRSDRSLIDPSAHSPARRRFADQEFHIKTTLKRSAALPQPRAESLWLSDNRKYFQGYCSGRARLSTLIIAFILISVAVSALIVVRGRAAEGRFSWPASLSRIFATRSAAKSVQPSTLSPPLPDISGSLFSATNASKTIALLNNGASVATTTTNGAGDYSFSGVSYSSGDVLTVFVSNDTVDNVKGATVTRGNSGNISSLNITQDALTLRQEDSGPVTNANLASGNPGTDADLNAIYTTGASSLLTTKPGKALLILSGTNFTPGGNIFAGGNWTNNGTFTAGAFTVDFNSSAGNQAISGNDSNFSTLTIDNVPVNPTPSTNNIVSINVPTTHITTALFVTHGVFTQGETSTNDFSLITNAVTVGTGATWRNFGKGDLTLSGDVSNAGTINFNASGTACGDTNDIAITSSNGSQRTWSGTGTFSMTDVAVDHQKVPGLLNPPLFILVNSGKDNGNNTGWQFVDQCTSGTYTWIGGTVGANTDWNVGTNWNPTRANLDNGDVLIFDRTSTPSPIVTNIPTQTISKLKFINGVAANFSNASVAGATAHTLTIGGASNDSLVVSSPSSLTLDGSPAITVLLTAGSKGDIQAGSGLTSGGQITLSGSAHRILASAADAITFADNSFFTTDTGFSGSPFGDGSSEGTAQSVEFLSGSFAAFHAGGNPFGTSNPAVVTFDSGSTQTFFANSAFSYDNRRYGNLILDGSQAYSGGAATQPLLCQNDLTIASGSSLSLSTALNGDLVLWANLTDNNGSGGITHNNGKVKFQGTGTIPSPLIQHVTTAATLGGVLISQTNGSVQIEANLSIEGELKFNSGNDLLVLNAKTLTLNGTVAGLGNLKGDGAARLTVGGSGALGTLRFLGGSQTLSQMTISRASSGSVTLGNNLLVDDTINLTNGVVDMDTFTLTINGIVARGSGYIIGNEQRSFSCSTSCTVPFDVGTANGYSPISEVIHVSSPGTYTQTIKATQGQHSGIHNLSANALQRFWTINKPAGPDTAPTADITFQYRGGDVVGSEANYKIFRYSGGFTRFDPSGPIDTVNHKATLNAVSAFSEWTLAEPNAVTTTVMSLKRVNGNPRSAPDATWQIIFADPVDGLTSSNFELVNTGLGGSPGITGVTAPGGTTPTTTWNITASTGTGQGTLGLNMVNDTNVTLGVTNLPFTGEVYDINHCPDPLIFTVDSTGDDPDNTPGDGLCDTGGDACTLRAAIMEANALSSCGTFDINITVTGTIIVGDTFDDPYETIDHDVNINGPGANQLSIDGAGSYRIFNIGNGRTVSIKDLTITNGNESQGGGIYNTGTLTITNTVVTGNTATTSGEGDGGGIFNQAGSLTVINSTISDNTASDGNGGGILNRDGATANISGSAISCNHADNGHAGGIQSGGDLTVINSTISGNTAQDGAGLAVGRNGSVHLTNTTISDNFATSSGGGIQNNNGGTADVFNTIIAGNFALDAGFDVLGDFNSTGHNLISIGDDSTGFTGTADQVGSFASPIDPRLGALADNGGPTFTHALLGGSPAIDGGDDSVTGSPLNLTTDQRGAGYARKDGVHVDIGAFELQSYVVNTTTDADDGSCTALGTGNGCTLREAIDAADNSSGNTRIAFAIPTAGPTPDPNCDVNGVCTITVDNSLGNLPVITKTVFIDGYTQPGASPNTLTLIGDDADPAIAGDNAELKIVIDGSSVANDGRGLDLEAGSDSSTIRGLVITHWNVAGIYINSSGGNTISGNFIGIDQTGTTAAGATGGVGVLITSDCDEFADENTIGGEFPELRNIISGNGASGIDLGGPDGSCSGFTSVEGNYIGTDRTGKLRVPNANHGVIVENGSEFNVIGCEVLDGDNLISGNTDAGVFITDTDSCAVQGNFIGTDRTGKAALANNRGVVINNSSDCFVGFSPIELSIFPNVISGNTLNGIELVGGSSLNYVLGNLVGTDLNGTAAVPNGKSGVLISEAGSNTIGDGFTGDGNLISGNGDKGIELLGASFNVIQGNFIGTDINGAVVAGLGNVTHGIELNVSGSSNSTDNLIGGSTECDCTIAQKAITRQSAAPRNAVAANRGTSAAGKAQVSAANRQSTARTRRAAGWSARRSQRSSIPANKRQQSKQQTTSGQRGALRTQGSLQPSVQNASAGNVIAGNGGDGVRVSGPADINNVISRNAIFANVLGIDLGGDGVTTNDRSDTGPNDTDDGANHLQNFPVINGYDANNSTVSGILESGGPAAQDPNGVEPFTIEIFRNTACDASLNGEGEKLVGWGTASLLSGGHYSFLITVAGPIQLGQTYTATATDGNGNTSEFSHCFVVMQSTTTVIANASLLSTTPSTFNSPFNVQWTVTPSGGGTPTGGTVTVNVASSAESCTAPVADGGCQITPTSAGTKQLTATYSGDTNYTGSSSSPPVSHVVDQASTTTTITNASSLSSTPSNIGELVTVQWSVASTPPGTTGTVSVTVDGNPGCSAPVSDGQCDVNPSTSGTKSLVAHYSGDGNFLASVSSSASHLVNSPLISGHVDYCITPSANVPGVTINVTGSQTTSTTTGSGGDYSINLTEGGTYTLTPTKTALAPLAPGIDTADVVGAQRHFLGLANLSGCALTAADADKDSAVDTVDVIAIQRFFLGSNTGTAHVGEWQFNPANRPYANLATSQSSQNYDALVVGDLTGDVTPAIANPDGGNSAAPDRIAPSAVATVSLPIDSIGTNVTNFTLAVTTSNISAADNLVGFQGDFTFDSSVVTFQGTPASPAGLTATNWNVTGNILGAGTIKTLRISAFSTTSTPLSGSGTLFNLNFTRVSNSINDTTQLTWAAAPNNFVFIDTSLAKQAPSSTPAGSITIVGPTAANGNISGQIVDSNNKPVEGAAVRMSGTQNRLTVTDAAGNYRFDSVETNGFYTVAPSRANFSFSPAQRSFSALGLHTNAAFNATLMSGFVNPLDTTEYFVRQQYLDFLGREPDEAGFNFWVNNIESCGENAQCRQAKRIDTSAAFFLSIEFQQTGYLVYKSYQAAYGDLPNAPVPIRLSEFKPDTAEIGNGVVVNQAGWETVLENNKRAFVTEFVQRPGFTAAFPTTMTPMEFVDRLFTNAGVTPSANDRTSAINEFGSATTSSDAVARGRALRRVAENSALAQREFNAAFVLMQYFGYLRRDANSGPDADFSGYTFWLDKLNAFDGNFRNADMVKAFLVSGEYRGRFPR